MKRTQQQTEDDLERHRPILISLAEACFLRLSWTYRRIRSRSADTHGSTLQYRRSGQAWTNAPFFAWLHSALKHNVLDAVKHLRDSKEQHCQKYPYRVISRTSFVRLEQLLVANDTSPSQVLQRNEDISRMLAALQTLPSNQRMAVILKHLRGHTLKEISEMLEVSESAVAGLLHRGRQQLLLCMKEDHDE